MTPNLIFIGLFICFGCSDNNTDLNHSETEVRDDTFKITGRVVLKEYLGEGGRIVTEEEKTYFEVDYGQNILVKVTLKTVEHPLMDKPYYRLNLKAYKSTDRKYDKLIWEVNSVEEIPVGIWGPSGKYFKTLNSGCCSTEDGYRLYDMETGKEFLSFTKLVDFHVPWTYVGYQADNSTTFDSDTDAAIIGNLFLFQLKEKDKPHLIQYDVYCESCIDDARFEHTPALEVRQQASLFDEGFFKLNSFYRNGEIADKMDTAGYYLIIKYDTKMVVLIPVTEDKGLLLNEMFSTDRDFSTALQILNRAPGFSVGGR